MQNSVDFPVNWCGASLIGCPVATANPISTPSELARLLALAKPKALVTSPSVAKVAQEAVDMLGNKVELLVSGTKESNSNLKSLDKLVDQVDNNYKIDRSGTSSFEITPSLTMSSLQYQLNATLLQ